MDAASPHRDFELTANQLIALAASIKGWGAELGFGQIGVSDIDLGQAEARLLEWLALGFHGEMRYFDRHGATRARPAELVPGTVRVISARLDYSPPDARDSHAVLDDGRIAFISRYALGRDYHKVMRTRLQRLADRIAAEIGAFGYRAFADSAPVMEVELATKAGLGWRGKHTLLSIAKAARTSSSARSIPICRCPSTPRKASTAARARAASMSARPRRSWRRIGSMRAAASRISPSSIPAAYRRSCAR
jgi:epoxyqueuosine reductase